MQVIRITQMAHLGVLVLLFCVFFAFVGWPIGLWWLLLLPVAAAVWIERTRTAVSADGLDLRTVFGSRHLDWAQVAGVSIPKRGFVRAHLDDDTEVKLPAVSYDRLRDLIRASNGRIPDLFAAEAAAREAQYEAREAETKTASTEEREAETTSAEAENGEAETTTADTEGSKAEAKKVEGHKTETNGRGAGRKTGTTAPDETEAPAADTAAPDSDS